MQKALALKLRALPSASAGPLRSYTSLRSLYTPYTSLALLDASIYPCSTSRRLESVRSFTLCSHRLGRKDGALLDDRPRLAQKRTASPKAIRGTRDRRSNPSAHVISHPQHPRSTRSGVHSSKSSRSAQEPRDEKKFLAKVVSTLSLPTIADIPTLPKNVLEYPVDVMESAKQYLAEVKENYSSNHGEYKHIIDVDDPMVGTLQIVGDGPSAKVARKVANLRLLATLHEKNVVGTVFPPSGKKVEEERDAMLDVYLYAARYGDVPLITTKIVTTKPMRSRKHKLNIFEVQVGLPLLEITTFGRSRTRGKATTIAALNMKQAMERLLQGNDLAHKHVKEDEVFGLQSAADFIQWYKFENRGMTSEFKTEAGRVSSGEFYSLLAINETAAEEEREFGMAQSSSKKSAESLAQLIAAVTLTQEQPHLRAQFFQEYRKNNNQVLAPIAPLDFEIAEETMASIRRTINASKTAAEQLEEEDEDVAGQSERGRGTIYSPLPQALHKRKCNDLQERQQTYSARKDLAALRKTRSEYPMNQYNEEVLSTIESNIYSIVIGATGSGKTTQVPQILLNDAIAKGNGASCNIICTQPRRIAAKSVAQRVADERAEPIGDCVGYHVKKDAKLPQYGGSINYCTTGILSQQLQFAADDIMDNVSHIILDEVHERDTIIDFTLTTLKRLVKARIAEGKRVPRITLMSATIDADLFAGYLSTKNDQGETLDCPTLTVPGRTFPVKEFYLDDVLKNIQSSSIQETLQRDSDTAKFIAFEQDFSRDNKILVDEGKQINETASAAIDWAAERRKAMQKSNISIEEQEQALVPHTLVASTIMHIASSTDQGAILTFLPGLEDIGKVKDILQIPRNGSLDFSDETKFKIYMLHSSIANTQKEVFDELPAGCRKIILATNIAETSITIPDVQHVVDTGKHRELQYDQMRRITKLACVWISKSNAKQRAGRAGRVQDGNYYALYSKERYKSLRAVGLPELLRSDLQEVCLDVKNQGFAVPVKEFLSEAIEPPAAESVDRALSSLVELQALNGDETLTPLGKLLAQLPVHPSLGKMIVLGIVFRCLDPMLIIGSSFSERSLFLQPLDSRKEAAEARAKFSRNTLSDHIGILAAVKELRMIDKVRGQRAVYDYGMRNYLHVGAYRGILSTAEAIEELLAEHGVIPRTSKMKRVQFQFGDSRLNENSDKVGLIKALVLAGFYPNLGVRRGRLTYRTNRTASALVYPKSINASDLKHKNKDKMPLPDPKTELLSFSELARSSDGNTLYLRDTTPVTPLVSVLFSGKVEAKSRNKIQMDDWLPFYLKDSSQIPPLFSLRNMLQKVTSAAFRDLAARRALLDHEQRNRFADLLVSVLDADLASYAAKPREGRSLTNARGTPSSAFAGFGKELGKNDRSNDPKSSDAWNFLNSNSGLPSGMGSSASRENPIPPSVLDLFSRGNDNTKAYKARNY